MAQDYEKGKKLALWTIILLGIITIVEVLIALIGKGYIIEGLRFPIWIMGIAMIGLSLFKGYKIVYEFMHMGHEVRGLRLSVLLPTILLIWALIAFINEGNSWLSKKNKVKDRDKIENTQSIQVQTLPTEETKELN